MTTDKQEIIIWIGTAILVVVAASLYLWLSAPEMDLLPETYNVM
jgi:flagellar biosynthesis/type III secretory pathway M-ring protein FliF/YscJ